MLQCHISRGGIEKRQLSFTDDITNMIDRDWHIAVTSIYDAAMDASLWDEVADALRIIVGSRGCVLMLTDLDSQDPWQLSAMCSTWRSLDMNRLEQYVREYGHYLEKPAFELLQKSPKQIAVTSEDMERLDPTLSREREDCRFCADHFGIYHRASIPPC